MWWIYFDTGAERAQHRIDSRRIPAGMRAPRTRTCTSLIVAGIIVCAVADEIVLMHPDHASGRGIAGDPRRAGAATSSATAWFKWLTNDRRTPPLSHMVGLALLASARLAGADSRDHAADLRDGYDVGVRSRGVLGNGRAVDEERVECRCSLSHFTAATMSL